MKSYNDLLLDILDVQGRRLEAELNSDHNKVRELRHEEKALRNQALRALNLKYSNIRGYNIRRKS